MRLAWILLVLLGCSENPLSSVEADLAAPSDLAITVADDPAPAGPDLADWCPASGPPPTCNGKPCGVGCICEVRFTLIPLDLGGSDGGPNVLRGPDDARCTCPGGGPTSLHGLHRCCGGLDCYEVRGDIGPHCMANNDCRR